MQKGSAVGPVRTDCEQTRADREAEKKGQEGGRELKSPQPSTGETNTAGCCIAVALQAQPRVCTEEEGRKLWDSLRKKCQQKAKAKVAAPKAWKDKREQWEAQVLQAVKNNEEKSIPVLRGAKVGRSLSPRSVGADCPVWGCTSSLLPSDTSCAHPSLSVQGSCVRGTPEWWGEGRKGPSAEDKESPEDKLSLCLLESSPLKR